MVDKVAYKLKLSSELCSIFPIFHIAMIKKCIGNPEYILPIKGLVMKENLPDEDVDV